MRKDWHLGEMDDGIRGFCVEVETATAAVSGANDRCQLDEDKGREQGDALDAVAFACPDAAAVAFPAGVLLHTDELFPPAG